MTPELIATLIFTLASMALSYGILQSKVNLMQETIKELETHIDKLKTKISDDLVSNQRFKEMIDIIRQDQLEIKESIKEIISMLSGKLQ